MDLSAFFKDEFAEHHDVARRAEAALAHDFAGLVHACTKAIRGGGKLMFLGTVEAPPMPNISRPN